MHQLDQWQEKGDQLIVCMDANEDIYQKLIGESLTKRDGLNMVEVVGKFTGKQLGPTFFRGSKPRGNMGNAEHRGNTRVCDAGRVWSRGPPLVCC